MPVYLPAFMSHAHSDNALTDPYENALSKRGIACYYDRAQPQTGHSLSLALQQEVERAKVLIVMVSPAMLDSFWVEQEIDMFFALMARDRSRKLIPVKIAPCEMPTRLSARWWLDATREPFDAIIDQLTRALEVTSSGSSGQRDHAGPFSRVVDWRQGMGDHTTIVAAIAAAQPGERILVRRGVYEGGLTIDKPLELIGDGQPGDAEVHASGGNVIKFTASQGRVANLTLRQTGGGNWFGVNIAAGRLELEDCDISSQSLACIGIHNGANPTLRHNRIHDGKESGIIVYEQGLGLLEDNDIFSNALAGVEIKEGSAPTLRRNRIHDGKEGGVMVGEQGQGLLEDNDIFSNASVGVAITSGGAPTLRHNRIYKNGYQAIWVYEQGGGVFEGNDLRDNTHGAWNIDDESKAKVTRSGNVE